MRTKLIVGITVMVGAVVLFFLSGGGKSGNVFYMTPTEFLSSPAKAGDRVIRVRSLLLACQDLCYLTKYKDLIII
ncbi:MAG TPA: hypothetical protein PLA03_09920 [Acidobacteriota bacterium]|nr:hypothetical protein [Acidobacteriota bacterium]